MTTKRELEILQHSLGIDQYGRGRSYRNHFVSSLESEDGKTCLELCRRGLMRQMKSSFSELTGGMPWFMVTSEGIEAVKKESPMPPKKTRSQLRYERYLSVSDCLGFSFREFLYWEKENA